MAQGMSPRARGMALVAAAGLLWSISGAFVKNLPLTGAGIAMYRAAFAGLGLLLVVMGRRTQLTLTMPMLPMVACFAAMNWLFLTSMTWTSAANAILLQYSASCWMVIGSVLFLGEPLDRKSLWTSLLAMLGIAYLAMGQWSESIQHRNGILLGLASGVAYAAVALFLRRLRSIDPIWLATVNHLGTAGCLWGLIFIGASADSSRPSFTNGPMLLGTLALFGLLQMALPYVLFGWGLRTVSAQEAGLITLIEPVLNPGWTYLFAGERPASTTIAGGAFFLLMLVLRYVPLPSLGSRTSRKESS